MVIVPVFWILSIVISVSGSIFIAKPKSNWTTGNSVCTLPSKDSIQPDDLQNITQNDKTVSNAWIGTRVKYSKWAANIGCSTGLSENIGTKDVTGVKDCLLYCSEIPSASFFAIKTSKCYCLSQKPKWTTGSFGCRKKCTDSLDALCSSGLSFMVFTIFTEINKMQIKSNGTYLEDECVVSNGDFSVLKVVTCSSKLSYGCIHTAKIHIPNTWYRYQEDCLKRKEFPQHNISNNNSPKSGEFYWTPVFRAHTSLNGEYDHTQKCLTVDTRMLTFTLEDCTEKFPFLCTKLGRRNVNTNQPGNSFPRYVTLPTSVIGAISIFVVILLVVIILVVIRMRRLKASCRKKIQILIEGEAGVQILTYDDIEPSQRTTDPRYMYNELQSVNMIDINIEGSHEELAETSMNDGVNDETDNQGYMVPEHQYHTIYDNPSSVSVDVHTCNIETVIYDENGYLTPT